MTNLPLIKKYCRACIHYIPMMGNRYICGFDSKTYEVEQNNIDEESGQPTCSCRNSGFEYDKEKFKGVRY